MPGDISEMRIKMRISKEFKRFQKTKKKGKDPILENIDISMIRGNERHIRIKLTGPKNTPYDGQYDFRMNMTENYPFDPPQVYLITKIYHPNIDKQGRICLSTLKKDTWSPSVTLRIMALSLMSLLDEPNLDDPLNMEVANHFKNNYDEALAKAVEYNKKYAI